VFAINSDASLGELVYARGYGLHYDGH